MPNSSKLLINFLLSSLLVLTLFLNNNTYADFINFEPYNLAYQEVPNPPKTDTKSYIIIDYNSGAIIGEYNAHKVLEPASLTKIMTMYVIDKELATGRISMDEEVKVSKKAWRMPGSRMFIEVNSMVKVRELIKGIIVQSGNDASVAMAEYIAGTEEAFVEIMNKTARDLGMKNTHFTNVTGMPNKEHYTTAFDLALLSRAIIRDFPESYELYSMKEYEYNDIKQINRNRLLWTAGLEADGIKTGYTDSAGYCLAASAEQDGMRLIAVVMGADSSRQRAKETASLLRYGYRFYDTVKLYSKNVPIGLKKIWLGEKDKVNIGLEKDVYITIPKGTYKYLSAKVDTKKYLKAPLDKYTNVGEININLRGEVIAKKQLVSLEQMPKGSLWQRFKDRVKLSFDKFMGHEHEIELKELS
jgi:D-alanyl-D-alanine carboxypeptidase (penicillin-binding protein 5/6)